VICKKCRKKIVGEKGIYKVFYLANNLEEAGRFHKKCAIKREREVKKFRWSLTFFIIIFIAVGGLIGFVTGERKIRSFRCR